MDEPMYMGTKGLKPRIGDVVMTSGDMRGIVIALKGNLVTVLGIGTSKETGDSFVLPQRHVQDYLVSQCHYLEKQTLNL